MQDFERRAKTVKWLIIVTAAVSILTPLLSFFLKRHGLEGPADWLPLTHSGFHQGRYWQLITPLFVQMPEHHITLSFLISLCFMMFLLWFAGKEIAMRFGSLRFLLLYFISGFVGSVVSLLWLHFTNSSEIVFGPSSGVFALLVVWAMLFRDLRLHYFTMIRIQARWLIGILIAIPLLIHLSQGQIALFLYNFAAIATAYVLGLLLFKLEPLFGRGKKIIDIRQAQKESDEEFMDRMLTKISKLGPGALTEKERDRMDAISKKRK